MCVRICDRALPCQNRTKNFKRYSSFTCDMITHFDDQTAPKAFSALQARVEEDAKQGSSDLALLLECPHVDAK